MALSSLVAGAVFASDFRIVRTLGEGGMGAVYVAEQISTGKQRALKTMHPQFVADAGLRERFAQEARIGAKIDSEHVVDVVAAGIDAETKMPWLAMELLKGETVADAVARGDLAGTQLASQALLQLGDALAEAHAAGVVHRDLKPENLFLTTTKRTDVPFVLKVLDFGIAKLLSENASSVTATIGTPMWMSPEQTELGAAITPATDIWAYGLIAFFVLTGRSYWHLQVDGRDVSSAALLRQIVLDPLVSATERARQLGATTTSLPAGFDAWFARCVARHASDRFGTGADALRELRKAFDVSSPSLASTVRADIGVAATQAALTPVAGRGATVPLIAPTPAPAPAPAAPTPAPAATTGNPVSDATRPPVGRRPRRRNALVTAAAVCAAIAIANGLPQKWMRQIAGSPASGAHPSATSSTSATSATSTASTASLPTAAPRSKSTPVSPRDGRLFSSTPVELKWSHGESGAREHDIEVARGDVVGEQGHSPPGVAYAMWPWAGEDVRPGSYRWRVREADAGWSEWATFAFYPSVLDRVEDQKKLRVGMETTYHEPFVYYDAQKKKVVGFDVDLANELASSLGVKVDRVSREWRELFVAAEAREVDVVISAITITKDRAKKYGFSEPYLRTGVVATTRASEARLAPPGTGKTIGAQRDTTAAQTAKRSFPQATFREYDTLDSAFAALARSEIDALLSDETVVLPRAEVKGGGYRIDSARLTDDAYGIMLPAGDERLRARVNAILNELVATGRIAELKKTYGIR